MINESPVIKRTLSLLRRVCLGAHATASYAQEGEDVLLRRLLDDKAAGFYVDVGAHHPERFSNTYLFYKRGWRGINIDPNPVAIRQFERKRPRDINLQFGIAETGGVATYYEFDEPALNTFDRELMEDRVRSTPYRLVRSTEVPVRRLDEVLRSRLPKGQGIDFMSVDVEGYDLAVLKSNDWRDFRPRWVLAEVLGATSMEQVAAGEVPAFLRQQGYALLAKTLNTVFFVDQHRD